MPWVHPGVRIATTRPTIDKVLLEPREGHVNLSVCRQNISSHFRLSNSTYKRGLTKFHAGEAEDISRESMLLDDQGRGMNGVADTLY